MDVAGDATWLPHRYDAVGDRIHFVAVPRHRHRAIPFLTDEYLPEARRPQVVGRAQAVAAAAAPAPLHFLFHSAFCCSTLLVRALDWPGAAMGLSEPVILNDLIGWRHRPPRPDGRQVARVLDQALGLLARPFAPGEAVVVKPSNLVNPLAPAMLGLRPQARALLLWAPLLDFLGSIARKEMWGRLWVRDLMVKLLREGLVNLGLEAEDYLRLTDLQAAAVGWLAQQAQFAQLAARFGPRVATLDSAQLMARPADSLAALAAHFQLSLDAAAIAAITAGPAFTRHAKTGQAFSAADRAAERDRGIAAHRAEIDMVHGWAVEVAARAGVPLALPAALLG